ncbi:MAG: protein kinase [Gammaproteobacteria bacterium]
MEQPANNDPRILVVEPDAKVRSAVLRYVVKGFEGSSVQSTSGTLEDVLGEHSRLKTFDVLLVGCDFAADGTGDNPTLRALRAIAADPSNPAVILLTTKGSEYSAVQAIKAGAFDYIPKALLGREQVLGAVQRALLARKGSVGGRGAGVAGMIRLFGYDMRRCLAKRENVSVHVAFSAERGKEVVLKVLHRGRGSISRDDNFDRLVTEFKLLYDIADRAVAEIYDFRVTSQYSYIAMEYFPLGHLGTQLTQALAPELALKHAAEIAHALSIVHTAGVVHRDLKPANIMLRDDRTVALIDFGISHQIEDMLNATAGQPIAGTPYYMSPEQARGQPTDERTDLYALGIILYQMLTGEKPFTGDTTDAIFEQHCTAAVPRLPPQLATYQPLLDKLLAKDAAQRLANAREVTETIELMSAVPKPADVPLPAVVVR